MWLPGRCPGPPLRRAACVACVQTALLQGQIKDKCIVCPAHGTAFDLAGTGAANPASLIAALGTAARLAATRAAARSPS